MIELLNHLTMAQIDYISTHINNLIKVGVHGKPLTRAEYMAERQTLERYLRIYKTKYAIDKNTQKMLEDYLTTISMPIVKVEDGVIVNG